MNETGLFKLHGKLISGNRFWWRFVGTVSDSYAKFEQNQMIFVPENRHEQVVQFLDSTSSRNVVGLAIYYKNIQGTKT